ncbi:MAG: cysteine desulfurase [Pseudomonadota bacterium]|nr:cysteine desulfurase [Pseudomonadota bacterium]
MSAPSYSITAVNDAGHGPDLAARRQDFPILERRLRGQPLVYLDNAATTQKPRAVIEAIARYYRECNSNIHRGVHTLSQEATERFEQARVKVQRFIHAAHSHEIIFVRGTTEAINLVAQSYGRPQLKPKDEILITAMEHHSNIVPWQLLCEQTGAVLKAVPMNDAGELLLDEYLRLLGSRTRMLALTHVSNALGTINPIREIIDHAHAYGVPVLVDGAQAVAHMPVDVQALDCDFYAFSSHKLFGPTGIGVLYGKTTLLEAMPPYQGGGDMIKSVTLTKTQFNDLPYKFEAGTPHIAGAIGLGAALDYVQEIGFEPIGRHEHELLRYASERVASLPGARIIGTAREKASVLSFVLEGIHPHDLGTVLDCQGIAIRTGHHCAMPVMERFHVPATARASFAFYNTPGEADRLCAALRDAQRMLG